MVTYAHAHAHALERPCKILGTMSENYCSFYEKCSDMMLESFWHFFHYKKCKIRIFSSFFFNLEKIWWPQVHAHARIKAPVRCLKNTDFFLKILLWPWKVWCIFSLKEVKKAADFFSFCKFEKIWRCLSISLVHTRARTHARACVSERLHCTWERPRTHQSEK